eukprot:TRINITY_DN8340_c0_g1_i1.p1 TRINITY_DN8340_c0_g1~~TRINITY_DN8340_c0_g1_i1.p1  ORF type:complete len:551 (+),score=107.43 TRINITY_DN8340_c0_g1_i1:88-1740(+)
MPPAKGEESFQDLLLAKVELARRMHGTAQMSKEMEKENCLAFNCKYQEGTREFAYEVKIKVTTFAQAKAAVLIVFLDVSKTNQIAQLRSNEEYKNSLLASISHELRTPLNCSINLLKDASNESGLPEEIQTNYIKPSLNASLLLLSFVNDITDFAEYQIRKLHLRFREFDLQEKVDEIMKYFTDLAIEKRITLETDIHEDVPTVIISEPDRFARVVINLISNAFKFTNRGKITLRIINDPENQSKLIVSVEDTGCGMSNDQLENLRSILANIDKYNLVKVVRNSRGVSLGLTMAQALCQVIGSKGLEYNSIRDVGTKVSFSLPIKAQQRRTVIMENPTLEVPLLSQPPLSKSMFHPSASHIPMLGTHQPSEVEVEVPDERSPPENQADLEHEFDVKEAAKITSSCEKCTCRRVLVVDDNDYNVMVLKSKLKRRGFKVESAANGEEAISSVKRILEQREVTCESSSCKKISLVFMDVDMPIMNGLEATEKLTGMIKGGAIPAIPIVGCSAFDSDKDISDGIKAGMSNYMPKPVMDDKLDSILKSLGLSPLI